MQFFVQTSPHPWCPVQVFVRSQTNATVSSFIWSTNYKQGMREGFCLTISNFAQSLATFVLKDLPLKKHETYFYFIGEKLSIVGHGRFNNFTKLAWFCYDQVSI